MPQGACARPTASVPASTDAAFPAATPSFLRQWAWLSAPKSQKTWRNNSTRSALAIRRRNLENGSNYSLCYPGSRDTLRHHYGARIHRLQQRTGTVRNHRVLFPAILGAILEMIANSKKRKAEGPANTNSNSGNSDSSTASCPAAAKAAPAPQETPKAHAPQETPKAPAPQETSRKNSETTATAAKCQPVIDPSVQYCPKCGTKQNAENVFCIACGSKIGQ